MPGGLRTCLCRCSLVDWLVDGMCVLCHPLDIFRVGEVPLCHLPFLFFRANRQRPSPVFFVFVLWMDVRWVRDHDLSRLRAMSETLIHFTRTRIIQAPTV